MRYELYNINYATLKRRGVTGDYTYILTSHKFPVKKSGFQSVDNLKDYYGSMPKTIYNEDTNKYERMTLTDDNVRFASSIARSKSKVLQLASNNPWDYFVTLTFDRDKIDRYDLSNIKSVMLKFFDNYRQRHCSDFRYLLVPEQHKDGAYHFHGLFCGIAPSDLIINEYGYLDFVPYRNKFGFCSLSKIQDFYACANYITKYISKDMFQNIPTPGTHLYFSSKGLKTDTLLRVGCLSSSFDADNLQCSDSEFCIKYFSNENIFNDCVVPFVNTVKPKDLKGIDIQALKRKTLFKFCHENNILISRFADLDSLYNRLRDDIISYNASEYERVKKQLQENNCVWSSKKLTKEDWEKLEAIFVHSAVSDCSAEGCTSVQSAVSELRCHCDHIFIRDAAVSKQLCIFDNAGDVNDS